MDYKGKLIEKNVGKKVKFETEQISGPSNDPVWRSTLFINDILIDSNVGKGSKISVEQSIAKKILSKMENEKPENSVEKQISQIADEMSEIKAQIKEMQETILSIINTNIEFQKTVVLQIQTQSQIIQRLVSNQPSE